MRRTIARASRRMAAAAAVIVAVCVSCEYSYRLTRTLGCRLAARAHPDGAFDLYAAGESTMVGMPYGPKMSPPNLVSLQFDGTIRGRIIVATNVAQAGESAFPQAVALERALSCRNDDDPGAVLIYSGNNDSGGPAPLTTVERIEEPLLARSDLFLELLFIAEKQFPRLRVRSIHSYEYFLRRMIETSLRHGLVPVISTVVSNRVDMDPGIPAAVVVPADEIRAILSQGEALESRGQNERAARFYMTQETRHPELKPFLRYRIGKCRQALGRYSDADDDFKQARDLPNADNFGRATPGQNDLIRALAREYALPLVDAEEIFDAHAPHGLPGNEFFADGQHPSAEGYLLLADAFADAVSARFQAQVACRFNNTDEAFQAAGLTEQDKLRAFLSTGRWLFSVSAMHHYPIQRLKMSKNAFETAIRLDPNDFSARLGLALTQAAANDDFMAKEENISFLERHRFFYGARYDVAETDLPGILERLKSNSVAVDAIQEIRRTYRSSSK